VQHPGPLTPPPPSGPLAPPGLSREDPRAAQTRQQQALNDGLGLDGGPREPAYPDYGSARPSYDSAYPGYEQIEDQSGSGDYPVQDGYDDYDDYADFAPDYDMRTEAPAGPAPTMANPVPAEFRNKTATKAAGRPASLVATLFGSPKKIAVLGASALCVIGAFAAIYIFLIQPGNEQAQANAPLPSPGTNSSATAACVKQYGQYCHITYRSDDPQPLSVSELYQKAVLNEQDHISFQQIATRTDKTCSNAVLGSALQNALGKKQCSQALRASYISGSGSKEIMGTIGVFNLNSTNQAHNAGKVVGQNDFIEPLATNSGVGANLGQSTGVMESQFKGHYLILTWAELANEATPTKSDDQKLQQFENDLIASTANIALSQRMVNGKPS
jgi:hypothetical protein